MGSFVAGSVSSQLMHLLRQPSAILEVLGGAAPLAARFFFTYLLLQVSNLKLIWVLRSQASTATLPASTLNMPLPVYPPAPGAAGQANGHAAPCGSGALRHAQPDVRHGAGEGKSGGVGLKGWAARLPPDVPPALPRPA